MRLPFEDTPPDLFAGDDMSLPSFEEVESFLKKPEEKNIEESEIPRESFEFWLQGSKNSLDNYAVHEAGQCEITSKMLKTIYHCASEWDAERLGDWCKEHDYDYCVIRRKNSTNREEILKWKVVSTKPFIEAWESQNFSRLRRSQRHGAN